MNKFFFLVTILSLVFSIVTFGCNDDKKDTENSKVESVKNKINWDYGTDIAIICSIDKEGFRDEETSSLLIVRWNREFGEEEVLLTEDFYNKENIIVKFDNDIPNSWNKINRVKDDDMANFILGLGKSSEVFYFEKPQEFISKLKTAKKLIIDSIDFGNIEGLKWDSKKFENRTNWIYHENVNEMDGTKSRFATVKNKSNSYSFELTIRNKKNKDEVLLLLNKEPYVFDWFQSSKICRVKFDDDAPVNFSYDMAENGNDLIFFNNSQNFISKLKKSQKLMIECPMYKGKNIIKFNNVKGLKWD